MNEQTRLVSLIEAFLNTGLGFVVSMAIWPFVGALYGIDYTPARHIGITVIFTVASLLRNYVVRRSFANKFHEIAIRIARRYSNGSR